MAGGNLRATTAASEHLQRLIQRQAHLCRIPPSRQLRGDGLAAVELGAKTGEAQRARAIVPWFCIVGAEPVTRLALPAPLAKRLLPIGVSRNASTAFLIDPLVSGRPPLLQRKLRHHRGLLRELYRGGVTD
jgi:hypothetical protein